MAALGRLKVWMIVGRPSWSAAAPFFAFSFLVNWAVSRPACRLLPHVEYLRDVACEGAFVDGLVQHCIPDTRGLPDALRVDVTAHKDDRKRWNLRSQGHRGVKPILTVLQAQVAQTHSPPTLVRQFQSLPRTAYCIDLGAPGLEQAREAIAHHAIVVHDQHGHTVEAERAGLPFARARRATRVRRSEGLAYAEHGPFTRSEAQG